MSPFQVSWSWLQNYVNNKLAAVPRQIKVSDKPKGKLVIECDEMWSFVFWLFGLCYAMDGGYKE
ncbi:hypothetical protein MICAG_4790002 [Microcystis aeruginosa PCC 9808]|uniref:Uncharacterized protein n=1 Tax=Microcystis aeruginosa PCC 9808 TaxID=1160284 RepID=I4I2E3_MICAE|nr:hypothetical protein MICAG_4790002 [Microcystis aeruginosa PCC 9808]